MLLGFKKQFVPLIEAGTKTHTIRADEKDRWKPGIKIHFCSGMRTKQMKIFKEGQVHSIQDIILTYHKHKFWYNPVVKIDGRKLSIEEIQKLAENDGFKTHGDMFHWFFPDGRLFKKAPIFKGKLIHWTQGKY